MLLLFLFQYCFVYKLFNTKVVGDIFVTERHENEKLNESITLQFISFLQAVYKKKRKQKAPIKV